MPRALALLVASAWLAGCTPEIGDKCILSTDCSIRGDRTCDTSQPAGYCTIRDCRGNGCPDDAACVLFEASLPGCGFDSRAPSRVGRSYCMASCADDTDCRSGYICADPKAAPWFAVVLDDDTSRRVCIAPPSTTTATSSTPSAPAPVCAPFTGNASFPPSVSSGPSATDAGAPDARADAQADAQADAAVDGGLAPADAASGG